MKILPNINLENYLYKIDSRLKDKTKKDIYMLYSLIFGALFVIPYLFFWDSSEKMFQDNKAQVLDISSKIKSDKIFLQNNPHSKITLLEKDISSAKIRLQRNKDNNKYIKKEIEAISSLFYDEKIWGEYLHSISINAKKYNVTILDFTNSSIMNNSSFGHMLDINIKSTANFNNTLKFINSLEQSNLVIDIHSLDIEAHEMLNTELNLSVWGIVYE
ncbi:MAG: hypothetical protein U9P72_10875 [Campylobacterota bacterium]|nr:hypothetical protein [Campylobacterota bacterium]